MPEGDTVWHTAVILRQALAGKVLTRCDIRVPRYATVDLTGQVVDEVVSQGKHLFIRVGSASIHSHLKMDGSWQVNPVGRPSRAGLTSGACRPSRADVSTTSRTDAMPARWPSTRPLCRRFAQRGPNPNSPDRDR